VFASISADHLLPLKDLTMLFLRTSVARLVTWSVAFALVAHGPLLSAGQRASGDTYESTAPSKPSQAPASIVQDVQLQAQGTLTARIVDLQGNPVVGEHVSVMFQEKEIAAIVSDDDGFASVSGLRPGLHAIVTPTSTTAYRFWNADSAPPSATSVPAIVSDEQIIRGQMGGGGLLGLAGLAAGIAGLVVALDAENTASNNKDAIKSLEARVKALEPASP